MGDFNQYFNNVVSGPKKLWGFIIAAISYLMFPAEAYKTAAMAVGIAMILDIATRFLALSHQAGGFWIAVKTRTIYSQTLWQKTFIKLTSYTVIAILTGLSYRVAFLESVGVFFGTVVYSVIFLREFQSNLENLSDAGADVAWLLKWTKKKQNTILEEVPTDDSGEPKS